MLHCTQTGPFSVAGSASVITSSTAVGVEEHQQHHVGVGHRLGRGAAHPGAVVGQRLGLRPASGSTRSPRCSARRSDRTIPAPMTPVPSTATRMSRILPGDAIGAGAAEPAMAIGSRTPSLLLGFRPARAPPVPRLRPPRSTTMSDPLSAADEAVLQRRRFLRGGALLAAAAGGAVAATAGERAARERVPGPTISTVTIAVPVFRVFDTRTDEGSWRSSRPRPTLRLQEPPAEGRLDRRGRVARATNEFGSSPSSST